MKSVIHDSGKGYRKDYRELSSALDGKSYWRLILRQRFKREQELSSYNDCYEIDFDTLGEQYRSDPVRMFHLVNGIHTVRMWVDEKRLQATEVARRVRVGKKDVPPRPIYNPPPLGKNAASRFRKKPLGKLPRLAVFNAPFEPDVCRPISRRPSLSGGTYVLGSRSESPGSADNTSSAFCNFRT